MTATPIEPWTKRINLKTAVRDFLKSNERFAIDKDIENRLLITVAPEGICGVQDDKDRDKRRTIRIRKMNTVFADASAWIQAGRFLSDQ